MKEKKIIQNSKSWKDLNETLSKLTKSKQSKLAGDINNTGKGILMHNYLNNDENDEISLEA